MLTCGTVSLEVHATLLPFIAPCLQDGGASIPSADMRPVALFTLPASHHILYNTVQSHVQCLQDGQGCWPVTRCAKSTAC
jgi:hypothetical protein